ncbi:MAG: signal peptide peptidase SppA [Phycisphaeraceae bacterium]
MPDETPNQSDQPQQPAPPAPPAPPAQIVQAAPQKKGGWLARGVAMVLLLVLSVSVMVNVYYAGFISMMTSGPYEEVYAEGPDDFRVAVLPIEGLIDGETYEFTRQSLKRLGEDPPAALVLRIDSGGGYVAPSDRIWHEVKRFREDNPGIPVIASFGGMAASGGYYVAMPADAIVAEPSGVTGSIGVIAQSFTFQDLLGKVGVTPETIVSTDSTRKDTLNPMRAWTEEDRQKLRKILDGSYARFVDVVVEGRKGVLDVEQVRALATGEAFTVEEAHESGLVDEIGYLDDAVALAVEKIGPDAADREPKVTMMTEMKGFGLGGLLRSRIPAGASLDAERIRGWAADASSPRLMYHWAP